VLSLSGKEECLDQELRARTASNVTSPFRDHENIALSDEASYVMILCSTTATPPLSLDSNDDLAWSRLLCGLGHIWRF
jgi:hypothetical protein